MTKVHFIAVPEAEDAVRALRARYGEAGPDAADIVVALGGDGFMLQTLHAFTAAGKPVYQRKGASHGRIVEPQYVGMMNAMMQETLQTGTAKKAELPGWQAAGKTGTSQDYRDAWFVAYTSQLVAGVWLGNDDNSPTKKATGDLPL